MTADESGQSDQNTCQLILMRHAKSDWSDHSLSDHERPLNNRGRRDAPRMAQWLTEIDMVPDVVLSSSSVRTRETVALMVEQWTNEPVLSFTDNLYHSSAESILTVIRSDACDARRLMVVAHNPGMAHLVSGLSNQLIEMPTAAIAIFQLQLADWNHVGPGTPIDLIQHMRPKAL